MISARHQVAAQITACSKSGMNRPPYSMQRLFKTYYQGRLTHVFQLLLSWELQGPAPQ